MQIAPGTRVGAYEIVSPLGRGGMGEVWKAQDTGLGRAVALKLLPAAFIADPERIARFKREAQLLASLNHPNIASIYGIHEVDGVSALVLEFIEGPTLSAQIARGAIPTKDALTIAMQIVEALEAAHDAGVIHRDLKPANIILQRATAVSHPVALDEVRVKVLDFGLAKPLTPPSSGEANLSNSPTMSSPAMTGVGVILGTAAYMAPEQARGRAIDRRVDVWAFGCVLYEMLTGRQAFAGEDVAETVGAVIHKDPDWTVLPADTPPSIRTLLRRCLQKDRRQRIPDIAMARLEIQDAMSEGSTAIVASQPARWREKIAWLMAAASLAVMAALGAMSWWRQTPVDPTSYLASVLPIEEAPITGVPPGRFALSPNGRYLAFISSRPGAGPRLWIRSLESGTARELPGTQGAAGAFWSPDSRFIAFHAQESLKKIDIEGGPPVSLTEASSGGSGGAWSKDDVIVFARLKAGLYRINAAGGVAVPVTKLDTAAGDDRHWWPYFLPDGKHFLYEAVGSSSSVDDPRAVYVASLDPDEPARLLLSPGSNAKYSQGYVLFMRENTLMAQPLDTSRFVLAGEALPVAENIDTGGATGQSGAFSVSGTGTLVYETAPGLPGNQLVWLDRTGKQIATVAERAAYESIELSPDATRAATAMSREVQNRSDIWIVDLVRGVRSPFTPGNRQETHAVWSPDGSRIVFNGGTTATSVRDLFVKPSNGSGSEQLIFTDSMNKTPLSWSHNSKFLLYSSGGPVDMNLWVIPLDGDTKPIPYMQTTYGEGWGRFSPDDKCVAFGSNESGRAEIYVAPFPARGGEKVRVSTTGAGGGIANIGARWRGDGRELFYVSPDRAMMSADIVECGTQIKIGAVRSLFRIPGSGLPVFDVDPNGQRFLVNVVEEARTPHALSLMINWTAALARR